MKHISFPLLTAEQIEVRVNTISDKGCSLLLYKDARSDMNILDDTVGAGSWQRRHYDCKGNLFCSIGININWAAPDLPPLWVYKDDCGTESNTEKQKGEASDSFKRAAFNWGIGRELYTAPFIWVGSDKVNLNDKGGKKTTYDKFAVEKIVYNEKGQMTALAITNTTKNMRAFVWQKA